MDIFTKNGQTIIHGDVFDGLATIQDGSVDLIFIDPPYNIGKKFKGTSDSWSSKTEYLEWCYQWLEICFRKLNDTGSMYFMSATQYMAYFDIFISQHLTILSRVVWAYDSSGVQAKKFYGSTYEPIVFAVKNKDQYTFNSEDILIEAKTGAKRKLIDYRKTPPQPYNTKKVPGNVWNFPRVRYRMDEYENHPSQKPVSLLKRVIMASSSVNDVVLDPFSGTFTTSFVSQQNSRNCIGIELSEEYVKTGIRRLNIDSHYKGQRLNPVKKSYTKNTFERTD